MEINKKAPATGRSEAVIQAPPEVVWAVLTKLEKWPDWNPAVKRIEMTGPLEPGTEFRWTAGGVKIRSILREVDAPHRIAWSGRATLGINAIHTWTLLPEGDATRAVTEESFDGFAVRLLRKRMSRELQTGLHQGLGALKSEAERQHVTQRAR